MKNTITLIACALVMRTIVAQQAVTTISIPSSADTLYQTISDGKYFIGIPVDSCNRVAEYISGISFFQFTTPQLYCMPSVNSEIERDCLIVAFYRKIEDGLTLQDALFSIVTLYQKNKYNTDWPKLLSEH